MQDLRADVRGLLLKLESLQGDLSSLMESYFLLVELVDALRVQSTNFHNRIFWWNHRVTGFTIAGHSTCAIQ